MKFIKSTLFLVCFTAILFAQNDGYTRIGVMNLRTNNNDSLMAVEAVYAIRDALLEIGRYNVHLPEHLRQAYEVIGRSYPESCREPRCASVLGSSLQLDRMIYGSVEFNNGNYAVKLQMINVQTRQVIDDRSYEGQGNAALRDVVRTTLMRMHEIDVFENAVDLRRYFGEQVNNIRPALISSGSVLGLGLFVALVGNDFQSTSVKIDESRSGVDPSMRSMSQSARAKAMGNSYIALSKDAYGAFYNPAGAAWVNGPEASLNFQNRFGLVNTVSGSYVNKVTREIGWGASLIYSGHPQSFYQELYFSSLGAYRFTDLWILPPFSVGANIHIMSSRTMGGSGSVYDQSGTAYGFGFDIGFLMEITRNIDFGFVLNNVPTINFFHNSSSSDKEIGANVYQEYRYRETSPPSFTLGGSFEVNHATLFVAEGRIPFYGDQNWRFAGGIEQQIANAVRLRFGAEREIFTRFETPWFLTCGGGVRFPVRQKIIDLDFSYEFMTDRELRHVWDISFKIQL